MHLALYIHLVAGGGGCGHIGPGVFATDNSIMARREPPRAPRRDKTGANSVTSLWSRVWFENVAWTWKGLLHNFFLIGPHIAARPAAYCCRNVWTNQKDWLTAPKRCDRIGAGFVTACAQHCQLPLVQSQLLKHCLSLLLVVSVMSEVGQNMYVSTSPECKILSILSMLLWILWFTVKFLWHLY